MTCYRFDLVARRVSRELLAETATAAHSGLTTDRLFLKYDTAVKPLGDGEVSTSIWRSRAFSYSWPESFGWLQVNGQLAEGVTVRMYLDGVLIHTTPSLVNNTPVRLPARKGYLVELEIQSAARVTGLAIGKTPSELL